MVELLQRDPQAATTTLMDFRKEPHALDASQAILAGSQNPQAQFHAIATLQAVGLQRWTGLSHEARKHLLLICWEKVLNTPPGGLERFVRGALLQACAVFWKRGWAGTSPGVVGSGAAAAEAADGWGEQTKAELLGGLANLINTGGANHMVDVADLLVAVIVEFSSSRNAKSAAMGLPLEFHRTAHAEFEKVRQNKPTPPSPPPPLATPPSLRRHWHCHCHHYRHIAHLPTTPTHPPHARSARTGSR